MSDNPRFIDLTILMRDDSGDSDQIMQVEIEKGATIRDLKMMIEEITQIPARIQLLWCENTVDPLEDWVSVLSSEVGSEIVLQFSSSEITVKVSTAVFKYPITLVLYGVDTISDVKEQVCDRIPWWKEAAKSEELDLSLDLYSISGRKYANNELKIGDVDDECKGLYLNINSIITVRMKEAVITESDESMEIFKIFMFKKRLEFHIKAMNSCSITVLNMLGLRGGKNLRVIDQDGNVLTKVQPNMYGELLYTSLR
ncbi:hypothetical protein P8452_10511 [Trifolium repens]|jgi:hypothetical protein|nr:hypothetical protein P8452_10511 [Trifolium repens]